MLLSVVEYSHCTLNILLLIRHLGENKNIEYIYICKAIHVWRKTVLKITKSVAHVIDNGHWGNAMCIWGGVYMGCNEIQIG